MNHEWPPIVHRTMIEIDEITPEPPDLALVAPRPRPQRGTNVLALTAAVLAVIAVIGGLTYLVGHDRPNGSSPTATVEPTTPPTAAQQVAPAASELATLTIPAINLTTPVLAGLAPEALARGVGHLPSSSEPGQLGNSVLEGERTTRTHPFLDLDKLQPGDVVIIETASGGHFEYTVTDTAVFADHQAARRALPTADGWATLTLYTCTPKYTTKHRLTVFAELDQNASDDPGVADPSPGDDDSEPTGLDC